MNQIWMLSEPTQNANSFSVRVSDGNTIYKAEIVSTTPQGFLTQQQTAELTFLTTVLQMKLIDTHSTIYCEGAEDFEEYLASNRVPLTGNLVLEAKFVNERNITGVKTETIDVKRSDDGEIELKKETTHKKEYRKERAPVALTTVGEYSVSAKALADAQSILSDIETAADLVSYLGSHQADWTTSFDEERKTRYFQCGELVFLVEFETFNDSVPVLVYGFKATNKYALAEIKLANRELYLQEHEWSALLNIVETNNLCGIGDFAVSSVRRVLRNLNARWVTNHQVAIAGLPFDLEFDNYGVLLNSNELLELGDKLEPKWRKPFTSPIGQVRLSKLTANKLETALKVDKNSVEFANAMRECMSKAPLEYAGRIEFSLEGVGLKVTYSGQQYIVSEVVPSAELSFVVETRFGYCKLYKHTEVESAFKKAFNIADDVELTQELVSSVTSGNVSLVVDVDTGYVVRSVYNGSNTPIIFTDLQVKCNLKRPRVHGLLSDMLVIDSIQTSGRNKPDSGKKGRSNRLTRKLQKVLGLKSAKEVNAYIDGLVKDPKPSMISSGHFEIQIEKSDYALLVDESDEVVDVVHSRNRLFYIKNPSCEFVIRRNSKIELPLQSSFKRLGFAKSYQLTRAFLAKTPMTIVSKNTDDNGVTCTELRCPEIGATLHLKSFSIKHLGEYPLPCLVGFSFN